jgi:hypothetical protein
MCAHFFLGNFLSLSIYTTTVGFRFLTLTSENEQKNIEFNGELPAAFGTILRVISREPSSQ